MEGIQCSLEGISVYNLGHMQCKNSQNEEVAITHHICLTENMAKNASVF